MKSQGSGKIGTYCTAHMTVRQNEAGLVYVEYNSTHIKKSIELAHLMFPEDIRLEVASKLQQSVEMERILDDIRDNYCHACIPVLMYMYGLMHLLTRQFVCTSTW